MQQTMYVASCDCPDFEDSWTTYDKDVQEALDSYSPSEEGVVVLCSPCGGKGAIPRGRLTCCDQCDGEGALPQGGGWIRCAACDGWGRVFPGQLDPELTFPDVSTNP